MENSEIDVSSMAKEVAYFAGLREAQNNNSGPFVIRKIHPFIKLTEKKIKYVPRKVCLGPYHHEVDFFEAMKMEAIMFQSYKRKCFDFLARLKQDKNIQYSSEETLEKYLDTMESIEQKIRNAYSEEISMDGRPFLQKILLDGCFILAQVLGSEETDQNSLPPYVKSWQNGFVACDMLLPECQIPFFAIEKIYELMVDKYTAGALRDRMVAFMDRIIFNSSYPKTIHIPENNKPKDFHHLLHLYHMYFKPTQYHKEMESGCNSSPNHSFAYRHHVDRWRRATAYDHVGIKLREKKFDEKNPHSLLDITFTNNVIEIPHLRMDVTTATLFKNIVALEQTEPERGNYFTAYVMFLSHIMCTSSDVAFLENNGIISHTLTSDNMVADIFSSLSENINFDFNGRYYLNHANRAVEESYQKSLNRWVVRTGLNKFPRGPCGFFLVLWLVYVIAEFFRTYLAGLKYCLVTAEY